MLIESIWALMVFSAEVNETSLFLVAELWYLGLDFDAVVVLCCRSVCENVRQQKPDPTQGLSWWFQFCRGWNVFPMKSCLGLQMELVINLLKQIRSAEWKGRILVGMLCAASPCCLWLPGKGLQRFTAHTSRTLHDKPHNFKEGILINQAAECHKYNLQTDVKCPCLSVLSSGVPVFRDDLMGAPWQVEIPLY